jgi:hypothetical protein
VSVVYATSADYTGQYPTAAVPANIDAQLRYASRLVRRDTQTAIYDVLNDGATPSDPNVAEAFTEATCAQVNSWVTAGIDPFASGLQKAGTAIASKSLDGKAISYDNSVNNSVAAFRARQALIEELCPEAVLILQDALIGLTRPWLRG